MQHCDARMGAQAGQRPAGLTEAEAAHRLAEEGPNILPVARGPSHLRELAAQMTNLFALMLWAAAGLAGEQLREARLRSALDGAGNARLQD